MDNVSERIERIREAEGKRTEERIRKHLEENKGSEKRFSFVSCRSVARELGIPEDEPVDCFTLYGVDLNPDWAGYRFEFVGIVTDEERTGAAVYAKKDGVQIRVKRMQVRHDDTQAYLEGIALPGWAGFISMNLMNLDFLDRSGNVEMLRTGLAMVYPYIHRQRPRGSGRFANADEFHAEYERVLAHMKRENIRPTPDLIAYHLGVSRSTFYDYRRKYGLGDSSPD